MGNCRIAVLLAAMTAVSACATQPTMQDATLYYGFTRIDPERKMAIKDSYLIERQGKIIRVGVGAPPRANFAVRKDLTGLYALPGLIDTHAHVTLGTVAVDMSNGAPQLSVKYDDSITEHNARMLLAYGVTTIRDPGGDAKINVAYRAAAARGDIVGPDALVAGPVIDRTPFPFPGLADIPSETRSIESIVNEQADDGVDFIKLYFYLTEVDIAKAISAARTRGLKTAGHLGVSWKAAAELGIDAIVHAMPSSPDDLEPAERDFYRKSARPGAFAFFEWWEAADLDGPVMKELIKTLAEKQVHVDLTLIVFRLAFWGDDPAVINEYVDIAHPAQEKDWRSFFRFDAGWTPDDYHRARAVWPKIERFARMLYEAGVPLTVGTDQGNPFVAPGASVVQEMELYEAAGIPNWSVLQMATDQAADILGLDKKTGRMAASLDADVVFVKSNPVEDIRTLLHPVLVLSNGRQFDPLALKSKSSTLVENRNAKALP